MQQPASAAEYLVSSEAQLRDTLADLSDGTNPDPSAVIILQNDIAVSATPLPTITKSLTIDTGSFTLSASGDTVLDVEAGQTLTVNGNIAGSNLFTKAGDGIAVFTGSSVYSGIYTVNEGVVEYRDGAQLNTETSSPTINVARGAGSSGSLLVTGPGTVLYGPLDLASGANSQALVEITNGGAIIYNGTDGLRASTGAGSTSSVIVSGAGSLLEATSRIESGYSSEAFFTVLDGGRINSGRVDFGGHSFLNGVSTIGVVSGAGSTWESSGTFGVFNGSLSVLDQGQVTATALDIAAGSGRAAEVFVSGAGSSITTTTGNVRISTSSGQGELTVAQGGRVTVNDGAGTIAITSSASGRGVLNIGGGEGEAAQGAGFIEAASINFGAGEGAIIFNHTETGYNFDIPIISNADGNGAIYQAAGRTIFNIDQLGFTGFTSVYGGTLEVNGALGGVMNVFGGTLAGIGAVGPTSHTGGNIAPGIAGVNNGLGDLTIAGDYNGQGGGALLIDTVLGGDDSLTDHLIITGNTQFGSNNSDGNPTQVFVTNLGGVGGQTVNGIRIIQVDGASQAGLFTLGAPAIGGAYLYGLFQGTPTVVDGDWYLRTTDILAPTVPVYENYPIVMLGLTELPTLQQRVGDRYWPGDEVADAAAGYAGPRNLWTRIEGAHGHVEGESTTGASYDSDRFLLQVGIDGLLAENGSGRLIGGFNAQYGRVDADISSDTGSGDSSTDSYGVGATLTWYGNDGIYVDGQASVNRLSSDLSADAVGDLADGNDGVGYAFSIEAGRKIGVGGSWSLTPQAQLAYTSVDFDDFTDPFGATVSLDSGDSLKGRIGVALNHDAADADRRSHVYGIANLTYEFLNGTAVDVAGVNVAFEPDSFGAELGVGGTYRWAGGKYALYGEALASTSFEGSHGVKGTLGFSTRF
ncbi:autotransporter outer membrane beta-barrel domain-containing protein [Mesorhizobium sp. YM1C-6-2]|uniref:autotransporter family protein n=1 Tax=Mesorhizobium sp. YM1C-6-2 TaxID=1827501 RepID=UPI001600D412|nr:autotransporter outer membrane beta-barrel domain-containing protein [Mesorhizobium sp. YM1C-6-2]